VLAAGRVRIAAQSVELGSTAAPERTDRERAGIGRSDLGSARREPGMRTVPTGTVASPFDPHLRNSENPDPRAGHFDRSAIACQSTEMKRARSDVSVTGRWRLGDLSGSGLATRSHGAMLRPAQPDDWT